MTKTIRVSVVIPDARNAGIIFKEGMEPGVIGYHDVGYDDHNKSDLQITLGALEVGEHLMKEMVKVELETIKE